MERKVFLRVEGMTCGSCVAAVTDALSAVSGTKDVSVDLKTNLATLSYAGNVQQLVDAVKNDAGKAASEMQIRKVRLRVDGMSCMGCVGGVTDALNTVPTASDVAVDLDAGIATLRYAGDDDVLVKAVSDQAGKDATVLTSVPEKRKITLRVDGMTCMSCVGRVTEALNACETAEDVNVDLKAGRATLVYAGDEDALIESIKKVAGKEAAVLEPQPELRKLSVRVDGMTCMGCVGNVTKALEGLETASDVSVDLESGLATLSYGGKDEPLIKAVMDVAGKVATVLPAEP